MAFRLPTFNLLCNIWRTGWAANNYATPSLPGVPCNLSPGKRVIVSLGDRTNVNQSVCLVMMELLLPPLTDIRASWTGQNTEDLVEVPAGSKRFYQVQHVDDSGKGFSNEYRLALMLFTGGVQSFVDTGPIAVPVPLP